MTDVTLSCWSNDQSVYGSVFTYRNRGRNVQLAVQKGRASPQRDRERDSRCI